MPTHLYSAGIRDPAIIYNCFKRPDYFRARFNLTLCPVRPTRAILDGACAKKPQARTFNASSFALFETIALQHVNFRIA